MYRSYKLNDRNQRLPFATRFLTMSNKKKYSWRISFEISSAYTILSCDTLIINKLNWCGVVINFVYP